jgi:hypothetical protein
MDSGINKGERGFRVREHAGQNLPATAARNRGSARSTILEYDKYRAIPAGPRKSTERMALLIAPNLPATAAARATFTSMEAADIRSVAVLESGISLSI